MKTNMRTRMILKSVGFTIIGGDVIHFYWGRGSGLGIILHKVYVFILAYYIKYLMISKGSIE